MREALSGELFDGGCRESVIQDRLQQKERPPKRARYRFFGRLPTLSLTAALKPTGCLRFFSRSANASSASSKTVAAVTQHRLDGLPRLDIELNVFTDHQSVRSRAVASSSQSDPLSQGVGISKEVGWTRG